MAVILNQVDFRSYQVLNVHPDVTFWEFYLNWMSASGDILTPDRYTHRNEHKCCRPPGLLSVGDNKTGNEN